MSQSDYIKYKRVSNQLIIDQKHVPHPINTTNVSYKQPTVFDSSVYTQFKEFTLENAIRNDNPILNDLTPSNTTIVWNMVKPINYCDRFFLCKNTNQRHIGSTTHFSSYAVPIPQPMNIKQRKAIEQGIIHKANACSCKKIYITL